MRIAIKKTKVYKFSELSKEAKEKAKQAYYDSETYDFLHDDLTDRLQELLNENKIKIDGELQLYYSLSCSQGDGVCFEGIFEWRKYTAHIKHTGREINEKSVSIELSDDNDECPDDETMKEFVNLYERICRHIANEGYSIWKYRMSDDEFSELSEANLYEYQENGKQYY